MGVGVCACMRGGVGGWEDVGRRMCGWICGYMYYASQYTMATNYRI